MTTYATMILRKSDVVQVLHIKNGELACGEIQTIRK
jgi:hypothetical protein